MIGQLGKDRRRDRHLPDRTDDQRITVGRLARDIFDRKSSAGAGLVLDDHRLPDIFRQLLSDESREQVVAAAGAEADDDADRLARIAGIALRESRINRAAVAVASKANSKTRMEPINRMDGLSLLA